MIIRAFSVYGTKVKENDRDLEVVLAVYNGSEGISYCSVNKGVSFFRFYKKDEVDIIDDAIPKTWIKKEYGNSTILSFKEWANDHVFPQYLFDDWAQNKTKWAEKLVDEWYQKIIDEYAIRLCGSIDKARAEANRILNDLINKEHTIEKLGITIQGKASFTGPISLNELQLILEPKLGIIQNFTKDANLYSW